MIAIERVATGVGLGLLFACASPASAAGCEVNPQGVNFGNYDSLSVIPLDGVGNIRVSCDLLTGFAVSLGSGNGTIEDRHMNGGAAQLRYNLYIGTTRLVVWGEGGAGSVSAFGTTVDMSVYGRIPARQNVPANVYVDAIIVTVTY